MGVRKFGDFFRGTIELRRRHLNELCYIFLL